MKETTENQEKLDKANRKLGLLMDEKAAAEASQTTMEQLEVRKQIKILQSEIKRLREIAYAPKPKDGDQNNEDFSNLPDEPTVDHFMDFAMSFDMSKNRDESQLTSSAGSSQAHVSGFFYSAAVSKESSSSNSTNDDFTQSTKIEVGFRASKVTIQRGGWFRPELLDDSKDMYKVGGEDEEKFTQVFPSYPTAFIVVKDVTIKVSMSSEKISDATAYLQENSSASCSFFCFSASKTRSSTMNSHSHYSCATSDGVIIRIPGPQILFWILEKVGEDETTAYPKDGSAIPDSFLSDEKKQNE